MRASAGILAVLVVGAVPSAARADLRSTAHNLAVAGPEASDTCRFCHTPHSKTPQGQSWARSKGAVIYKPYSSSTLKSRPGQPTGASKLCLSCHDGTLARSSSIEGLQLARSSSRDGADLDTDLSDDHPVSIRYDRALAAKNPELVDPAALDTSTLQLDTRGELQCTTCHDAHSSAFPDFLVVDNGYSGLCLRCHDLGGWRGSSHESSNARAAAVFSPRNGRRAGTVAASGCGSCHAVHGARGRQRLLRSDTEEENCLPCHDGSVGRANIAAEMRKRSAHAVSKFRGQHDAAETPFAMSQHVECEDCHNPHAVSGARRPAPLISGALEGARGLSAQGTPIDNARYEYEVCFRCHTNDASTSLDRVSLQPDIRRKLEQWNPSFHPITEVGKNPNVPSLLAPWTIESRINCTDCHANDQGPGAGGSGPRGPHGSAWPHLLEREYTMTDGVSESYQRYALCYKCHDQASILGDRSFSLHRLHIVEQRTSCATCHDPHGVDAGRGREENHTNLINFATLEVTPDSRGRLEFVDLGTYRGRCSLSCHGREHANTSYP